MASVTLEGVSKTFGTTRAVDNVSLAVADDSHEGAAATVVVADAAGGVLDRKTTTVGEAS